MSVESIINEGIKIKEKVNNFIENREIARRDRSLVIASFFSIITEHHNAIHLLIRNNFNGSAFSLVRIFYEVIYKFHWIYAVATDDQVDRYLKDQDVFPAMNIIVAEVDKKLDTDGFWKTIHTKTWKAMNSYTHSGILQTSRRFIDNNVSPNYSIDELSEVLAASNIIYIITTITLFRYFGWDAEVEKMNRVFCDYLDKNN